MIQPQKEISNQYIVIIFIKVLCGYIFLSCDQLSSNSYRLTQQIKIKKESLTKSNENSLPKELRPLFYFGIFSHPLNLKEIYTYNEVNTSVDKLKNTLQQFIDKGILYESDGYYGLESNIRDQIIRRNELTSLAEKYREKAIKRAFFIAKFPFVRAVMISGSFSKGIITEDGDVDYFIITKENRLWSARTFLILYKKLILLNSHKFFCVNYFLDETHVEIEERNLFTATEGITLMPIVGKKWCEDFQNKNQWINDYFANDTMRGLQETKPFKMSLFQKVFESLLNGYLGEKVEDFLRNKTIQYWKNKFRSLPPSRFKIALKSTKYVSKHHPQDFQYRVLTKMEEIRGNFAAKLEG